MFRHAIVRPPSENFADGLTRADLGVPDFARVLEQHAAYCAALQACGLSLTVLPADSRYPDSTFVEDTAVIVPEGAMLMRPGAPSRLGEAAAIEASLRTVFPSLANIVAPGTVDGGDICEAGRHVFIGLSHRTNADGGSQLAAWLATLGYTSAVVDVRDVSSILHLKSGLSWLGDGRLLVIDALAAHPAFADFERVVVEPAELYAANAIRVNSRVLIASGYPKLAQALADLGYRPLALEMSEFEKMDGGLSCLSLRF